MGEATVFIWVQRQKRFDWIILKAKDIQLSIIWPCWDDNLRRKHENNWQLVGNQPLLEYRRRVLVKLDIIDCAK